jgi:hypothetical protein
MDRGLTVTS